MKYARELVTSTVVGGLFIVVPVYLAVLLLLKGMKSAASLVRPLAVLVPDWLPAEDFLSLVLVLALCFLVGAAVRTRAGRAIRERMERMFFERLPGYGLLRSLTQRLAGDSDENAGSRHWSKSRTRWFRHSSSRNSTTADSRSSCRRCPHRSPAPCTSSAANACTSSTSRSPRPQIRLSLGLRVERPRGGDAKGTGPRTARSRDTARESCRLSSARRMK